MFLFSTFHNHILKKKKGKSNLVVLVFQVNASLEVRNVPDTRPSGPGACPIFTRVCAKWHFNSGVPAAWEQGRSGRAAGRGGCSLYSTGSVLVVWSASLTFTSVRLEALARIDVKSSCMFILCSTSENNSARRCAFLFFKFCCFSQQRLLSGCF